MEYGSTYKENMMRMIKCSCGQTYTSENNNSTQCPDCQKFLGAYCQHHIEPFHKGLITTSRKTLSGVEYGMAICMGVLWCRSIDLSIVKH